MDPSGGTVDTAAIIRSGQLPGWLVEWGPLGNRRRGVAMKQREGSEKLVVFDKSKNKMVKVDMSASRVMKVAPAAEEFSKITIEKSLQKLRESDEQDSSLELMKSLMKNLSERQLDPHLALAKASGAVPAGVMPDALADHEDSDRYDSDFEIDSIDSAMDIAVAGMSSKETLNIRDSSRTQDSDDNSSEHDSGSADDESDETAESSDEEEEGEESDTDSSEGEGEESDSEDSSDSNEEDSEGETGGRTVELKVTIQPEGLVRGFSLKKKGAVKKVLKLLEEDYGMQPQLFYHDPDGDDILVHGQTDFDYVVKCHRRSTITKKNKLRLAAIFSEGSPSAGVHGHDRLPKAEMTAVFGATAAPVSDLAPGAKAAVCHIGKSSSVPDISADRSSATAYTARATTAAGDNFSTVDNILMQPTSPPAADGERSPRVRQLFARAADKQTNFSPRDSYETITSPLKGVRKQVSGEVIDPSIAETDDGLTPIAPSTANNKEFLWQRGEVIGAGSFGQVFSGIDLKSGRRIAIKEVVFGRTQRQREQALSLQLELTILSKLSHPNVIEYLGAEYTTDTLRIFLELASEGSVKDALNVFGPFPEPLLRIYVADVVNGLSFLHSKGYIHRDIKPSNLLIDKGRVKLADFGCSTTFLLNEDGNTSVNDHGTVVGTTIYMSPQVMRGGAAEDVDEAPEGYGRKADVWSLGVTLVEMASGKPPYRNAAAAIYSVCVTKDYPKFGEGMSPEAYHFLDRCLVEETRYRADCKELLAEPFVTERLCDRPQLTAHAALNDDDRKMSSTLFFAPNEDFTLSSDHIGVDSASPDRSDDSRNDYDHLMQNNAFGLGSGRATHNSSAKSTGLPDLNFEQLNGQQRNVYTERSTDATDRLPRKEGDSGSGTGSGQYSSLVGIIDMGFAKVTLDINPHSRSSVDGEVSCDAVGEDPDATIIRAQEKGKCVHTGAMSAIDKSQKNEEVEYGFDDSIIFSDTGQDNPATNPIPDESEDYTYSSALFARKRTS